MWHRESLGRNIFLGEVEVPLDTWNWDSEATWLPLQPRVRAGVQSNTDVPPLPHGPPSTCRRFHRASLGLKLVVTPLGKACQPGCPFLESVAHRPQRSPVPNTLLSTTVSQLPLACFTTERPTSGFFRFLRLQMSFPAVDCSLCPSSTSLQAQRVSERPSWTGPWDVRDLFHEVVV